MTKVKDIVERLRQDFPEDIASKGDPVGMQIGSMDADVTKVMTTLDVRPQVVEEAVKKGVNFIVSHHPVMFRPARNLNFANAQNAMYMARLSKMELLFIQFIPILIKLKMVLPIGRLKN